MANNNKLNEYLAQLSEKVNTLRKLSEEMRSQELTRSHNQVQAELTTVLDEMKELHEKVQGLLKS